VVIARTAITGASQSCLFQIVASWLAISQGQPPAAIIDDDADIIRVVEARCGAMERSTTPFSLLSNGEGDYWPKVLADWLESPMPAERDAITALERQQPRLALSSTSSRRLPRTCRGISRSQTSPLWRPRQERP